LPSLFTPPAETSTPLTPDELLDYFESKIENVRVSTENAPPPNIPDGCPQSPSLAAFDEITPQNVEKLLADSAVKQCELDSMPVRLIKTLRHAFAPILAMLINISLISGILPETQKRAIIRPRIKKPGFRRHHSTETAVVKVYNDIVLAIDAGFITALLLLDFSAAFDCVDHAILIQILQHQFGITSTVLLWITSFLSNRSHKVRIGSQTSRTYNILFGVPQGSILGPLLFILYTSSITNIAHRHGITIHLYADDTQLYIKLSTSDIINAKARLLHCIEEIQTWSASMRLKLNASKTELIWFERKP
jgi:hypothetical protein